MLPSAAKAIPAAGTGISLPVTANASSESDLLMQASTTEGFAQ